MQSDAPRAQRGASRSLNLIIYESAHAGKLPPVKRVALFLPGRVKQRKHESANVSFCDPVQSTGFSKQTITREPIDRLMSRNPHPACPVYPVKPRFCSRRRGEA